MVQINIKCPHCQFEKNVDRIKIPDNLKNVKCPQCKESFPFELPEEEFVIEEIPIATYGGEKRQASLKAIKNGVVAACLSGFVTLGVALIAIVSNTDGAFAYWNDPTIFFDAFLIFACAFGIHKKSRAASILLFVYFVFSKIIIGFETGKVSGLWVGLVFLYFYGKAIQGTFTYHAIEKAENPNYKATPKWVYFVGAPALAIFIILMGLGVLSMTGVMPSTEVQAGTRIAKSDIKLLYSENILDRDDNIEYFYSTGFTSILEGGTIMTDESVILYLPGEEGDISVYEIFFEEITKVDQVQKGGFLEDSVYQINTSIPDVWMQIVLSTENGGDEKFIETLRSKID